MIRKLAYRIHPASVVAMLALFIALGGVSYAAVGKIGSKDIKNGAVTKVKIKKDAVTGAKVKESTLGTVPDAAKLAGQVPAGFESKGFGGGGDSDFVTLSPESVKEVASQPLPAGTYLVLARGGLNNNSAEVAGSNQACTLTAGGTAQTISFAALDANGKPADREEFNLFLVATLPAAGNAVLSCETNSKWKSGNVIDPTLAAVSLQP